MNRAGGLELLMPMVQPREIWEASGRWQTMGDELMRFKGRGDGEFCLGGTHEEVIVDFVRKDIKSYRHLPVILYQIQTKFRNELRPRFGLMRGREFIMKDAYSFDVSREEAERSYQKMARAYRAIFERTGLEYRIVSADSGQIGGDQSQEFHVLADSGEDQLFYSDGGKFAANKDVCPAIDPPLPEFDRGINDEDLRDLSRFDTPGARTIVDLSRLTGVAARSLVKTMFFSVAEDPRELTPIAILLRGDDEVNPIKVKSLFKLSQPPLLLSDREVQELTGASPGSCGPVGLDIPIYLDRGVESLRNYIVGANQDGVHLKDVNHHRDFKVAGIDDFRMVKEGDGSPEGDGLLKSCRGIEVGHIFYLGTTYSQAMDAHFLDKEGRESPLEMGCYGIGVGRTVQASIEQNHDKDGIIWPIALAPFHVHICLLDPDDEKVFQVAQKIYDDLWSRGVECLMDDRSERPGVKFKDADLLGMPLRLTVGGRGLSNGKVDMVVRRTKEVVALSIEDVVSSVYDFIHSDKIV